MRIVWWRDRFGQRKTSGRITLLAGRPQGAENSNTLAGAGMTVDLDPSP
jgi:hypothetical protein